MGIAIVVDWGDNPAMGFAWQLPVVPLLIGLNAFFVAAEYALVASRSSQIENLRVKGRMRAAAAMDRLKSDMAGAIGAIQVCITLMNLLLGWIGEPAMSKVLGVLFSPVVEVLPPTLFVTVSTALSFVLVTLLTVVFSELLPKAMTLQHIEFVAWLTAAPVLRIRQGIRPLVWLMNAMANLITRPLGLGRVERIEAEHHTAEEIYRIAAESAEAGALTPRERSLVLNSLTLGRKRARQIMVPRRSVTYFDLRRSMEENLEAMSERLYSRLPLCDGGMERVVGLVHTKEFLLAYQEGAGPEVLSLIARPAVRAPVGIGLDELLTVFRDRGSHLVLLVDERGGVAGIVTLTDVVDEILGEMHEAPLNRESGGGSSKAMEGGWSM